MALLLDDDEENMPLYKIRKTENRLQSRAFTSSSLPDSVSDTPVLFNRKGGDGIRKMELLMYGSPIVLPTPVKLPTACLSAPFSPTATSKSACTERSSAFSEGNTECVKPIFLGAGNLIENQCRTQPKECLSMDCIDADDDKNARSVGKVMSKCKPMVFNSISHMKTTTCVSPTGIRASHDFFEESNVSPDRLSANKSTYCVERSLWEDLEVQSHVHDPHSLSEISLPIHTDEKLTSATSSSVCRLSTCGAAEGKSAQKQQLKLSDFFAKMACKRK